MVNNTTILDKPQQVVTLSGETEPANSIDDMVLAIIDWFQQFDRIRVDNPDWAALTHPGQELAIKTFCCVADEINWVPLQNPDTGLVTAVCLIDIMVSIADRMTDRYHYTTSDRDQFIDTWVQWVQRLAITAS